MKKLKRKFIKSRQEGPLILYKSKDNFMFSWIYEDQELCAVHVMDDYDEVTKAVFSVIKSKGV